jgi:Holliday junction resolvase RusA-like endonuclease
VNLVRFTVPFAPVAKARARTTWTNQGPRHYTPEATCNWEKTVALYARKAMAAREPLQGPIAVSLAFFLPIPVSWPLWKRQEAAAGRIAPTSVPDLDNLEKGLADGCKGICWADDAQVVQSLTWKGYALNPRAEASITPLENLLPAQVTRRPQAPVEA